MHAPANSDPWKRVRMMCVGIAMNYIWEIVFCDVHINIIKKSDRKSKMQACVKFAMQENTKLFIEYRTRYQH